MALYQNYLGLNEQAQVKLADVGPVEFNDHFCKTLPFYKDTLLTAAEIAALDTVPKELLAAPGAGLTLTCLGVFAFLDAGATPYDIDTNENLEIHYKADASGAKVATMTNAVIESATDAFQSIVPITAVALENQPLVAIMGDAIAAGDGTITLRVYYQVVRTADFL